MQTFRLIWAIIFMWLSDDRWMGFSQLILLAALHYNFAIRNRLNVQIYVEFSNKSFSVRCLRWWCWELSNLKRLYDQNAWILKPEVERCCQVVGCALHNEQQFKVLTPDSEEVDLKENYAINFCSLVLKKMDCVFFGWNVRFFVTAKMSFFVPIISRQHKYFIRRIESPVDGLVVAYDDDDHRHFIVTKTDKWFSPHIDWGIKKTTRFET